MSHTHTRHSRAALITIVEAAVCHTFAAELGDYANAKELDILVPLPSLLQHRCRHSGLVTARSAAVYFMACAGLSHHFIAVHYGITRQAAEKSIRRISIRIKRDTLFNIRVHAALDAVTAQFITMQVQAVRIPA